MLFIYGRRLNVVEEFPYETAETFKQLFSSKKKESIGYCIQGEILYLFSSDNKFGVKKINLNSKMKTTWENYKFNESEGGKDKLVTCDALLFGDLFFRRTTT